MCRERRKDVENKMNSQNLKKFEESVKETLEECSEEGWNGYEAYPVSAVSIEHMRRFVNKLDDEIFPTDFGAVPTSELDCEWYKEDAYNIVLGIDDESTAHWAGRVKSGKSQYGKFLFENTIDEEFLYFLKSVLLGRIT